MNRKEIIEKLFNDIRSQVGLFALLTGTPQSFVDETYVADKTTTGGRIPSLDFDKQRSFDIMIAHIEYRLESFNIALERVKNNG